MTRRMLAAALAVTLLAAVSSPSFARSSHRVKIQVITNEILQSDTNSEAGIVTGTLGHGAIILNDTNWRAHFTPGRTLKSSGVIFYSAGSIKFTTRLKNTSLPGGGVNRTGTMTVKGGTGKFRRAAGKFKITGDSPPDSTKSHLFITATLTY